MISQIKELNFPEYATLSSATVTLNDMGDRTISTQVKIDGAIVPDFSYDWEVEFKGETYIQPLRQPQASKGNESINYAIDLTFYHKTIWQLKRYYFAEMTSVESGTAIADQYISSLGLNLSDFCVAFQKVLDYYFQGRITIDLNPDVEYDNDVKLMSISYSYIWDVLQKVYEFYGVRWVIEGNTIKVGYPSVELSHTFQYGHDGGLLRVERQVQDANIRNSLLGRGGEKNLPAYYFKEAPEGSLFASDPDAIPELANIYFSNLRGKTFRDYVKGWKAKHYGGTPMDEPTEAYTKGYTDDKFSPIEYVEDKISIGKYGLLQGALDNNEEIYPSIQGAPNGEDVVVYVEPVKSDDVEQSVGKSDSVTLKGMSQYRQITREQNGGYIEVELQSEIFEVSELSALSISNGVTYGVYQGFSFEQKWEGNPLVDVDEIVTNVVSNVEANKDFLPSGKYQVTTRFKITLPIYDNWPSVGSAENISFYAQLGVSTNLSLRNEIEYDNDGLWKPTFDIWVKNIWGSTRNDGENDLSYAERVWRPILGDRQGNEAKVCFSSGWLSGHEDYEFTIVDFAYDNSREHNGTQSEWRLTLQKSDAELEATGKYIPSASTNGQAYAGDTFFFIGIDMPRQYVIWAEERLDNYKTSSLNEVSEIQPKWVVNFDKLRLHEGVDNLAEQIVVGGSINLADVRFIDAPSLQLYLQSVTYTWNEQTLLYPDIEVVLADTIVPVQNPVAQLQGSIDNINSQLHDIGNIAQIVRKVADSLYLRKDGVADVSKSPTKFVGDVSGHNFRRGHVGGSDWGIYHDVHGNAICEFDKIIARRDFVVNNLVVNQVSAIGGTQIMSAAAVTCSRVLEDVNGYKCFFDQKGGSIANLFAINDIAYSQIFDVNNNSIKYYKRIVKEVGIDYITLSNIDGEFDGEGIPEDGDHIIQIGNTTNVARQSVVIIDPKEGGSIKVYANIDGFNLEDKNYVGIGVNSDTNEAYMFAYGDLYIGDRDIYEDGANYITFQKKDGEDKRRLFISADVKLGAGSEGLSNLSEFNSVAQVANDAKDLAESLKDQIDGRVTAHYGEGEPSTDKDPAKTWIANGEEEAHLNDTYTDTETGKSWRWLFKNNTYQWVIITDTSVTEALQKAQEALDLANTKVDVFVTKPVSPYKVKDLWLQGDSGRIMRCKTTRTTSGLFYSSDWIPADQDAAALANAALSSAKDYTNAKVEDLRTEINNTISTINGNIDEINADLGNKSNELESQKKAIEEAQADLENVYDKATVDGKITEAEQNAINQAQKDLDEAYKEYVAKAEEIATEQINEFINGQYQTDIDELRGQVDGKAETYYQSSDPKDSWEADTYSHHVGDLWCDSDTGVIQSWDGTNWVTPTANVPEAVFDKIDGKSAIYVSIPSTYFDDDMWVLERDYSEYKTGFKKGVVVFANKDGENKNSTNLSNYAWEDWDIKVSYTDDTVANEAKDAAEAAQKAADDAKAEAEAAQERMDGWVADGVITQMEKQAIASELAFVIGDYNSIAAQAEKYGGDSSIMPIIEQPYNSYKAMLEAIINALNIEGVESTTSNANLQNAQSTYYAARTTALQMIAELAKSLIDAVDKKVSDFDYLKEALPSGAETKIGAGVVLSSILGVHDAGGNVVAAMIDPKSITDQADVPYFAAGIGDVESIATTSKAMISEDGEIQLQDTNVAASSRRKVKLNTGFMKFMLGDNVSLEQTPDEYTATPSADMAFGSFTSEETPDVTIGLPASFSPSNTLKEESFLIKTFDVGDSFTSITVAGGSGLGPTVKNLSSRTYTVKFRLTNESGSYVDGTSKSVAPTSSSSLGVSIYGMYVSGTSTNIAKFKNQRVRLELVVTTTSTPAGSVDLTVTFGVLYNKVVIAGNVTTSAYANRLFGNGFFFAKSETQYAGLIVDAENGPVAEFKNGNQGFRFTNAGLRRWHTKLGWIPIDGVIIRGKIYTYGGDSAAQTIGSKTIKNYVDSSTVTTSSLTTADHSIRITLPTTISSKILSSDYMVQLTGLRRSGTSSGSFSGTNGIFASVYAQTNTYFDVYTGDNETENTGGFYFEVKVID